MPKSVRIVVVLMLALIGLSGCAMIAKQGAVSIAEIDEDVGLVRLSAPWTEGVTVRRIRYVDNTELEEYALYDGPAGRAELFYAAVTDDRYALADRLNISLAIERFAFVRGRAVDIGPSSEMSSGPALIFYRPFRLEGVARSCLGFKAAWDDVAYDPERRPSKLFFGYHCAAADTSPDREAIERAITRFVFTPMPEVRLAASPPEVEKVALDLARGAARGSEFGIPDFPLLLARPYQEDGLGEQHDPF